MKDKIGNEKGLFFEAFINEIKLFYKTGMVQYNNRVANHPREVVLFAGKIEELPESILIEHEVTKEDLLKRIGELPYCLIYKEAEHSYKLL